YELLGRFEWHWLVATLGEIELRSGQDAEAKSMPLGKLAPHIAQLAGFGFSILTTPELDFSKGSYKPVPLESAEQLVRVFDEGVAKVRGALLSAPDEAWKESWKLSFQGKALFSGSC